MEMSLEEQLRCMQEMRSYLEQFCLQMNVVMDELGNDIEDLKNQGFSKETAQTYRQKYYQKAKEEVDTFVSHVQQNHFDYIDRVMEYLNGALSEQ